MNITQKRPIVYIDTTGDGWKKFYNLFGEQFDIHFFDNGISFFNWYKKGGQADAVITSCELNASHGLPLLRSLRADKSLRRLPFIMLVDRITDKKRQLCFREGVSELFEQPINREAILTRLSFLIDYPYDLFREHNPAPAPAPPVYRMPLAKRLFDIFVALSALLRFRRCCC